MTFNPLKSIARLYRLGSQSLPFPRSRQELSLVRSHQSREEEEKAKRGLICISLMHINSSKMDVNRMMPESFQWCPATGWEATSTNAQDDLQRYLPTLEILWFIFSAPSWSLPCPDHPKPGPGVPFLGLASSFCYGLWFSLTYSFSWGSASSNSFTQNKTEAVSDSASLSVLHYYRDISRTISVM